MSKIATQNNRNKSTERGLQNTNKNDQTNKLKENQSFIFGKICEAIHKLISDNYDLPKSIEPQHLKLYSVQGNIMQTSSPLPVYTELNAIVQN